MAKHTEQIGTPGVLKKRGHRTAVEDGCSSIKNYVRTHYFRTAKMKIRGKIRVTRAMMVKGLAYH